MATLVSEGWSSLACGSVCPSPLGTKVEEEHREEVEEIIPALRTSSVVPDSKVSTSSTGVLSTGVFLPYLIP